MSDACCLRFRQSHLHWTFCCSAQCSQLKSRADVFAPAIARLANMSIQDRSVLFLLEEGLGVALPLLKKAGLDNSSPANYRPISNLSTISRVLDRLVLTRLQPHLLSSANFKDFQSASIKGHSTETALLQILDEVITSRLQSCRQRSVLTIQLRLAEIKPQSVLSRP